ncbi:(acyl-carrier-protein) S-malonyltransferase [Gammaproteobacteria bacterium]
MDSVNNFCSNLVELLRHWATITPEALAYTFLKDGRDEGLRYTYRQLDEHARAIAVALSGARGERALLLYPPGVEFIAGFFGALYAGVIAIPAPPPDAARLKRTLPRLNAIIRDAEASLVLATGEFVDILATEMAASGEFPPMRWLATDRVDTTQAHESSGFPSIDDTTIAYLQYTSGSTSTPKGVMLTHRNIMRQSATLQRGFGYDRDSVEVTWMPYFHDYGLIDGLIQPLYNGIPCYVLSPITFLRRPERWLEAISRYRGTHTQAPNFAYEQCIQKISAAQRSTLDLSCLRETSNGAEPIRRDTVEGFITAFAGCGLRPEAVYPSYGLAEATLLVVTKPHRTLPRYCHVDATALEQNRIVVVDPRRTDKNYRSIVSCGMPAPGVEVVIADPTTTCALPDGEVGEIWVSGDSIGAGYWRRPEESETTFRARLVDQPERGPFLRTGDLGFMLDGELYITGRQKDLIIVAGVNHYPQDIEWTVQTLDTAFRRDHCAAFSIDVDGEERLVVVAEMENQLDDWSLLLNAVRRAISETHELELYGLQLLRKGEVLKTSSGKLQRRGCRDAYLNHRFEAFFRWQRGEFAPALASAKIEAWSERKDPQTIENWIITQLARQLDLPPTIIKLTTPFAEYGLSSRGAVTFVGELEQWLGTEELPATLLWEYSTVATLRDHLSASPAAKKEPAGEVALDAHEPLAIIGMACRVPGANNPDEFWELLATGRDAIDKVPPTRWPAEKFYAPQAGTPGHINNRHGGFLDVVDQFDAAFFGIAPPEATVMDPQQRLLLELTWEALEAANINPRQLAGSDTGVFIGISTDDYSERQFADRDRISPYAGPGKALSIAANRISYQFDLHGPSMAIDTACSSSLVALHQAALALRGGDCTLALVGGVNLLLSPNMSIALSQAGMLSPDGRCKAFDASANGYVRGEGGGIVVLKRLSDARRDGDAILALLRGSAVNQDGRSNGLTAPNGLAQQAVIRRALQDAGVDASAIRVVEAHGTGTALGDPIEVRSLQVVLGSGRSAEQSCLIGSVKSNIGHLEAAAGIAGLIKLILSIRQSQVPQTVHFKTLNPMITLQGTPFAVADRLQPWPAGERLASISSFGFGGTNAHAILSAPIPSPLSSTEKSSNPDHHLLLISAHTPTALYTLAERYLAHLRQLPAGACAACCYSAATGRAALTQRLALVGTNHTFLESALEAFVARREDAAPMVSVPNQPSKIAWLFTGQGSQYSGMGKIFYQDDPTFRAEIDRCNRVLEPLLGMPLGELLWDERHAALLDNTRYTQPALFALEVALARMLLRWGIRPDAIMGHSVGEYSAACVAGLFSLEDGLRLIAARGRLVEELGGSGGMAAVIADEATVRAALIGIDAVELATLNGPAGQVISGSHAALEVATAQLIAAGLEVRPLKVSHPFHSAGMEPVRAPFAAVARTIRFQPPQIPLVSNLTADFTGQQMAHADYWINHLRQPVRFGASVERLLAAGYDTFLEIGPKPTLIGMARHLDDAARCLWLPTLRAGEPEWQRLLTTLGRLWQRDVAIDWSTFYGAHRYPRIDLPYYPFERKRFWLDESLPTRTTNVAVINLPGEMIRSPFLSGTLFQARFSLERLPFYGEHRVFGEIVVPAAGHLSLLLEAALALNGEPACQLANLIFPQPLILPADGERWVQLFVENGTGARPFQLISRVADAAFETHASGSLDHAALTPLLPATTLTAVQATLQPNGYVDNFYTSIWQPHIELGPSFRCIETFVRHGDEALARLRMPIKHDNLQLYPGLFDSALQVLATLVTLDANEAMIPFSIERMAYHGYGDRRPQHFWSHITLRTSDDPAMAIADARLWTKLDDGDHILVAELMGFRARRVQRESLLRELRRGYQDHLYQLDWRPYSVTAMTPNTGRWLLFNDHTGRAAALAVRQCHTVIEVSRAEQIAMHPTVNGVLFGAGLDLVGIPDMTALEPVLTLLLAVIGQLADHPLPLVILTAGGQTLLDRAGEPLQAALWALGRVTRRELPALQCRLIDLESTTERDAALPQLLQGDHPVELAWRDGRLYQPFLLSYHLTPAASVAPIRADRSYLVTGGLGELGLILAEWLVSQGAGAVTLLGRRAPNAAQQSRVEILRASAAIRVIKGDVTDGPRLAALWPDLVAGSLPLAGIFHLAGVLDDGPLQQQSWERFVPVLAPKINGTWHLHQLSQTLALDHFIAFSSITPLVGSAGQGNYAFANAYLDGLMAQRRAVGLPGLALNWGPWRGGMAADLTRRFTEWGLEMIDPARALTTLAALLAAQLPAQLAIFPVDWGRFIHRGGTNQLYNHLQPSTTTEAITQRWADIVAAAETSQRWILLEQRLRETIAATIGLSDGNALAARKRLFEIGLDSLGAVELRNRLATMLGQDLRSTLLFDYPTLEALLGHIGNDVLGWQRLDVAAAKVTTQATQLELDSLSDDALAAMLAAELGNL